MKNVKTQVEEFRRYIRGLNEATPLDHRVELFTTIQHLWDELGKFPDIAEEVCRKLKITPQLFSACVDNPNLIKSVERLGRHLRGGWLQDYLEWTGTHEAPEEFHLWNGLAALATAVGRRAAIVSAKYVIYPNQFVITVSSPANTRKTSAARLAKKLIKQSAVCPIFEGKPTPEYIAQDLGKRKENAHFLMFAPEMRILLGQERYMAHLFPFLQEMWECHDSWDAGNKSTGRLPILNACMNFLGCMNPPDLPLLLSRNSGHGSLMSRIICLYQDESSREFALPQDETERDTYLENALVERLQSLGQMEFQRFGFSKDGGEWFKDYYSGWKKAVKYSDRSGVDFLSRQDVHLQKIAVLLAISERQGTELNADTLRRAQTIIKDAHEKMRALLHAESPVSMNGEPDVVSLIFRFLDKAGGTMTRQNLLKKTIQNHVFAQRLDPSLKYLEQAGMVKSFFAGDDNKTLYYMKVRGPNEDQTK